MNLGTPAVSSPVVPENPPFLVSAHVDSVFSSDVRHVLEVGSDHITGPGIDNSIGLAAVVALPKLLDFLNIRIQR